MSFLFHFIDLGLQAIQCVKYVVNACGYLDSHVDKDSVIYTELWCLYLMYQFLLIVFNNLPSPSCTALVFPGQFGCVHLHTYCTILYHPGTLGLPSDLYYVFRKYILTVQYTPYSFLVWEVSCFNLKGPPFLSVVFHMLLVLQEYWVYIPASRACHYLTQEPGLSYTSISVMGGPYNLIQQDAMDRCMTRIFFPQLK